MLREPQLQDVRSKLKETISQNLAALQLLREKLGELSRPVKIQPRTATTVSLVGSDGGHSQQGVNPFLTQFMRVVDSYDQEHALEVVSSQESLDSIWLRHQALGIDGKPTPVKALMDVLEIRCPEQMRELSPVFSESDASKRSSSWLQVYRQITEWAVLLRLVQSDYAADTLFVWDGPLRTKIFPRTSFAKLVGAIDAALERQLRERNRRYYIAGIVRRSNVLERFRLAMALEGVMRQSYPCYSRLTGRLIQEAITWIEYLSATERLTADESIGGKTVDVFSAGQMYFVKFGSRPSDPVWVADIWESQVSFEQQIFGYLLNDSVNGFPIPFFPQCLQLAQRYAALADFDMDIFSNEYGKHLRRALGNDADIVDELEFQGSSFTSQANR